LHPATLRGVASRIAVQDDLMSKPLLLAAAVAALGATALSGCVIIAAD